MKPKENVPLAPFTTMRVGGSARYFFNVSTVDELCEALSFAKDNKLTFFVLGLGSNVIVPDEGYGGVVIKIEISGIEYEKCGKKVRVIAGAGERLDFLVNETIKKGLYGLENLSFIPGTVGAAPVQNTGAYGVEVKDVIEWVEVVSIDTFKIKKFSNQECNFGYRESFFKTQKKKKYIITRVSFLLNTEGILNMEYHDIAEYISNHKIKEVTPSVLREAILAIRAEKFSGVEKAGTAGSFFKNPVISKKRLCKLLKIYPDIKYSLEGVDNVKIPAAWLLDHVGGFKGFKKGNVGTCPTQALFILNYGGSAQEISAMAESITKDIKEKTGITLETEVQYLK